MKSKELKFGAYVWGALAVANQCLPSPELWSGVFLIIAFIHAVGAEILREFGR